MFGCVLPDGFHQRGEVPVHTEFWKVAHIEPLNAHENVNEAGISEALAAPQVIGGGKIIPDLVRDVVGIEDLSELSPEPISHFLRNDIFVTFHPRKRKIKQRIVDGLCSAGIVEFTEIVEKELEIYVLQKYGLLGLEQTTRFTRGYDLYLF